MEREWLFSKLVGHPAFSYKGLPNDISDLRLTYPHCMNLPVSSSMSFMRMTDIHNLAYATGEKDVVGIVPASPPLLLWNTKYDYNAYSVSGNREFNPNDCIVNNHRELVDLLYAKLYKSDPRSEAHVQLLASMVEAGAAILGGAAIALVDPHPRKLDDIDVFVTADCIGLITTLIDAYLDAQEAQHLPYRCIVGKSVFNISCEGLPMLQIHRDVSLNYPNAIQTFYDHNSMVGFYMFERHLQLICTPMAYVCLALRVYAPTSLQNSYRFHKMMERNMYLYFAPHHRIRISENIQMIPTNMVTISAVGDNTLSHVICTNRDHHCIYEETYPHKTTRCLYIDDASPDTLSLTAYKRHKQVYLRNNLIASVTYPVYLRSLLGISVVLDAQIEDIFYGELKVGKQVYATPTYTDIVKPEQLFYSKVNVENDLPHNGYVPIICGGTDDEPELLITMVLTKMSLQDSNVDLNIHNVSILSCIGYRHAHSDLPSDTFVHCNNTITLYRVHRTIDNGVSPQPIPIVANLDKRELNVGIIHKRKTLADVVNEEYDGEEKRDEDTA